jgi:hypothetical protein
MSVYTGECKCPPRHLAKRCSRYARIASPKHVADLTARGELLTWINGLLGTDHQKIEMLGTGAIYCQVRVESFRMDAHRTMIAAKRG